MSYYTFLAKTAVETYVKERKIITPPSNLPSELKNRKAGVFVTIKNKNNLRGCIGTYLPIRKNIAEEIIYNAIAACTEDYRFNPIQKSELPYLSYTVYILNKPELVKDINELNPKKYGVIIKTAPIVSSNKTDVIFDGHLPFKSGLLLPNLEGIDTIEKQLSLACQKGGIDPQNEKIIIYKFSAEKYE